LKAITEMNGGSQPFQGGEGAELGLKSFFSPNSVALIGASPKKNKISHILMKNLVSSKSIEEVFPVNPNYDEVMDRASYDSILEIPEKIDLAVISLPAKITPPIVEQCVEKGVPGIVIISSGFSEKEGKEGEELEEEIRSQIEGTTTSILGPNTLGYYIPKTDLDVMFLKKEVFGRPKEGHIGLLSQSGSLGVDFLNELHNNRTGLSLFLSLGNKLDIDENDVIEYLAQDDNTRCISMYLEGISNGERFFQLCKDVSKEKPIVILKGGKSDSGGKATSLHTGKMGGEYKVIKGVFQQAGMIEAEDEVELLDLSETFASLPEPDGNRVMVITNGGGNGIVAADLLELKWKDQIKLADLPEVAKNDLKGILPDYISPNNPVDLSAESTNSDYKDTVEYIMKKDLADIVLVGITVNQTLDPELADHMKDLMEKYRVPLVVYHKGFSDQNEMIKKMKEDDIPSFPSVKRSVNALGSFLKWYNDR